MEKKTKPETETTAAPIQREPIVPEKVPRNDGGKGSLATAEAGVSLQERRKRPRISETPPAPPPPPKLDDYEPIIGRPELDELRFLARYLRGKSVKMVNSTAVGGGVAEILNRLIPLMNELEVA